MLRLLAAHYKIIVLWGVIFAGVSGVASWLFPHYYSAVTKVVIISRDRAGVDPYTQAKSAELIGENLAQVMQTSDFRDKVIKARPELFKDAAWANLPERPFRKKWNKDVEAHMVFGGSLLQITAFAPAASAAIDLAETVTRTLVESGWEYIGGDVAIKRVDSPLASRFPARPNFALNAIIGFIIGGLLAALWVARYRRS